MGDNKRLTVKPLAGAGKVRNLPERVAAGEPSSRVLIIAKARTSNYTPPNVQVRSRVDAHLFTAECALSDLLALEKNPEIESVEVAETLPPLD